MRFLFDLSANADRIVYRDERALPAGLNAKLEARRAAGTCTPRPNPTYVRPKPDKEPGPISLFIGSCLLVAIIGAIFGQIGAIVTAILVAIAWAGNIWIAVTDREKKRLALTESDMEALARASHMIELPPPASLRTVVAQPYGQRRVLMLIRTAAEIATRLKATRSWTSTYLDSHRIQFDPDEDVGEVILHAKDLHDAICVLGSGPHGNTPTAVVAQHAFDAARKPLDLVWGRLVARVAALDDYCTHLEQLDVELENAEVAKRALGFRDEIGDLLANAVGDEIATEQLHRMSDDTTALAAAIRELVDELNGDLETLMALAPLHPDNLRP